MSNAETALLAAAQAGQGNATSSIIRAAREFLNWLNEHTPNDPA